MESGNIGGVWDGGAVLAIIMAEEVYTDHNNNHLQKLISQTNFMNKIEE